MRRFACFAIAALACASAAAQNYSGTFTTVNQQGGTVTLVLKQDAQSQVKGTLTGNNNSFQVAAQATPQGLMGTVTGQQGNLYLMAQYEGASLVVILAEPGPNGQANLQSARRIVFAKAGAGAPAPKKDAAAPPKAAGGVDGQLTQLLTRNAWCGFTYNQRSGTSTRERVVFNGNGTVMRNSGSETYNSGPAGSVAGQYGSANQARWKVADGMLHFSQDG
ncbi:MAG TPA: hypothetical protein VGJ74_13685, partial [Burkholderiales bacterium]